MHVTGRTTRINPISLIGKANNRINCRILVGLGTAQSSGANCTYIRLFIEFGGFGDWWGAWNSSISHFDGVRVPSLESYIYRPHVGGALKWIHYIPYFVCFVYFIRSESSISSIKYSKSNEYNLDHYNFVKTLAKKKTKTKYNSQKINFPLNSDQIYEQRVLKNTKHRLKWTVWMDWEPSQLLCIAPLSLSLAATLRFHSFCATKHNSAFSALCTNIRMKRLTTERYNNYIFAPVRMEAVACAHTHTSRTASIHLFRITHIKMVVEKYR